MTREQIIKAFEMKLDGFSMEYIASEFGCTKQNISEIFKNIIKKKGSIKLSNSVFPNLITEIAGRYKSEKEFCKIVDIDYSHFVRVNEGLARPSFDDIVKCCESLNKDVLYLFKKRSDNNAE